MTNIKILALFREYESILPKRGDLIIDRITPLRILDFVVNLRNPEVLIEDASKPGGVVILFVEVDGRAFLVREDTYLTAMSANCRTDGSINRIRIARDLIGWEPLCVPSKKSIVEYLAKESQN